jgi:hypothetical protein
VPPPADAPAAPLDAPLPVDAPSAPMDAPLPADPQAAPHGTYADQLQQAIDNQGISGNADLESALAQL